MITMLLLTDVTPHKAVAGRSNRLILKGMGLYSGDELKLITGTETCEDEGLLAVVNDSRASLFFPTVDVRYHVCYRYHMVSESWFEYPAIVVSTVSLEVSSVTPAFAFVYQPTTVSVIGEGVATSCVKFVPYGESCVTDGVQ